MEPCIVASFYTPDTGYEASAKDRLIPSLNKFSIEHMVVPKDHRGSWTKNIYMKPLIIARAMRQNPGINVVWLDADAEVCAHPTMFFSNGSDFSAHYRRPKGNLSSGTMYFRNNTVTMRLVESWDRAITAHPEFGKITEQAVLEEIKSDHMCVYGQFPLEYSTIFDGPQPDKPVVIKHHQASRSFRTALDNLPADQ